MQFFSHRLTEKPPSMLKPNSGSGYIRPAHNSIWRCLFWVIPPALPFPISFTVSQFTTKPNRYLALVVPFFSRSTTVSLFPLRINAFLGILRLIWLDLLVFSGMELSFHKNYWDLNESVLFFYYSRSSQVIFFSNILDL